MTEIRNPIPLISHALQNEGQEISSILIMGAGESGQAMARWAHSQGVHVYLHDTRPQDSLSKTVQEKMTEFQDLGMQISNGKEEALLPLETCNVIAMSPGISPLDPWVAGLLSKAKAMNIPVWGELDLFTKALKALQRERNYQPKVVAITGTNGKTTTTALSGVILAKTGLHVAVAGNISPSLLDKLSECLLEEQLPDIWVLELSSYQLYYSTDFNPDTATVLNISEDHLDWHGDMEHYCSAKKKIFGVDTIPVLNRDDSAVMAMIDKKRYDMGRVITFGTDTPLEPDHFGIVGDKSGGIDWLAWVMPTEESGQRRSKKAKELAQTYEQPLQVKKLIPAEALLIKGRHNATNTLAALGLGQALQLSMASLLHGLRDYRGEPHRVQSIAVINDVEYIDDSKGTNVGATVAAIEGLGMHAGEKKIILIAGGDGKGQNFAPLAPVIQQYVKTLYLIGKDAPKIAEVIDHQKVQLLYVTTLEEAVAKAAAQAIVGDKVLLSPACASFDMFKDYVHRASVFLSAVEELKYQIQKVEVGQ
jgi:UDP-N-acetylmuramoylalanine--D-glutamate ligase